MLKVSLLLDNIVAFSILNLKLCWISK